MNIGYVSGFVLDTRIQQMRCLTFWGLYSSVGVRDTDNNWVNIWILSYSDIQKKINIRWRERDSLAAISLGRWHLSRALKVEKYSVMWISRQKYFSVKSWPYKDHNLWNILGIFNKFQRGEFMWNVVKGKCRSWGQARIQG